ncbi:MAG: hypothetical protein Q9166_007827 [cf. Caloplaca sp. 2 TL-2023]
MAIQISVAAIWGIGAGVFVVILTAIIVIFIQLRKKHQGPQETINRNTSQRRAHLSITDEDVRRMPGMRKLRPTPYDHPPGWAPISSRESVTKRGLTPNPADVDPITGVPPWPVRIPRRLKKSQSNPVVRIPPAALSPITERSTNNMATSPSLSAATNLEFKMGDQRKVSLGVEVYRPSGRPSLDSSPGYLRPKPLFHGQQRSLSHGKLTEFTSDTKGNGSFQASTQDVELRSLPVARMPRSSSLCSQHPGQAPTIPVPPLPFELPTSKKLQAKKGPSEMTPQRVSGMSLLSGNTSVLNESASRAFPQAETDFTSISLTSPPGSQSTPIGLGISTGSNPKWNFSRIDRSASPLSASKARNVRPQISQQQSFRASIHNSLPRSPSSGLSMSLLDRTSPNPKAALNPPKSTLEVPPSRRSKVPQLSPMKGMNVFQINEAKRAKRASTSVLQAVSGNQISPIKNPWHDRPSSIATDDPFRWDPKTSMQQPMRPSAMRNPAQRHKRQSCVRISNIPIIIPSPNPYRLSTSSLQPSISPLTSPLPSLFIKPTNQNQNSRPDSITSLRPPSLATFNPQLPKGIRSPKRTSSTKPHKENSPYSPTFSMIPLYAPHSPTRSVPSSADTSLASTPTRKPSTSISQRRPAQNPNRRRAIFPPSSVHGPGWPPLLSSSITPTDPPTMVQPPSPQYVETATIIPESGDITTSSPERPPSFLFQFPSPPLTTSTFAGSRQQQEEQQQPPPRHPQHTIRLPSRSPSPIKASTSPSCIHTSIRGPRPLPTASTTRRSRILKSSSGSPRASLNGRRSASPAKVDLLRRSILELRRMNSEVHSFNGAREGGHRRYLSLGDEGDLVEEEQRVMGPREMVGTPKEDARGKRGSGMGMGKGTAGSLYDGEGFLRESGVAV